MNLKYSRTNSFTVKRPSVPVVSDDIVSFSEKERSIVKLCGTMKFKVINGVKPSNAGLI